MTSFRFLAFFWIFRTFSAEASVTTEDIYVPLESSRIEANIENETSSQKPQRDPNPAQLEAGLSSWAPGSFTLPSVVPGAGAFQAQAPRFSANLSFPLPYLAGLSARLGGSWLELQRSASLGSASFGAPLSQSVQLLSVRIGTEYAPPNFSWEMFQPFASASLLPSVAVAPSSAFETDGNTYLGLPVEFELGSRIKLSALGKAWSDFELDVSGVGTAGVIQHSSVAGLGINGGVRVAL